MKVLVKDRYVHDFFEVYAVGKTRSGATEIYLIKHPMGGAGSAAITSGRANVIKPLDCEVNAIKREYRWMYDYDLTTDLPPVSVSSNEEALTLLQDIEPF